MPQPGMRWRHVTISTHRSWLPGDPRGFRSRDHKIHSSGDYKQPPPDGEHAGLHEYSKRVSGASVIIPPELRATVGGAIIAKLQRLGHRLLALSVAGTHAHLLVELPDDVKTIRVILGECKRVASVAVRARLPGQVWGYGGGFKPVDDATYQRRVYRYILAQEGAWTWSFKDDPGGGENPGDVETPGNRCAHPGA